MFSTLCSTQMGLLDEMLLNGKRERESGRAKIGRESERRSEHEKMKKNSER